MGNDAGVELVGPDGVLAELTKRLIEPGLGEELSEHLGYEPGDAAGRGSGNNRNGTSPETLLTDIAAFDLDIPKDRNGTFDPPLVPKHSRRLKGFEANIVHLEARAVIRLYNDVADQRVAWTQRLHATLFHLGVPTITAPLASDQGRTALAAAELTAATGQAVDVAIGQIDAANTVLAPIKLQLARLSRRQPGCRGLQVHYGIGPLTSVAIWAEMGDTRRFSSSSDAVGHAGLDITVSASDVHRAKGHLSRQGPSVLRWALYEAAMSAAKQAAPDHDYWMSLRERLGAQRAASTIARKLARRCHHTLRTLGDEAWVDGA